MMANKNLDENNQKYLIRNLFKKKFKDNKSFPMIWCIVLHPTEYHIPFYESLYKLSKKNSLILFMDNISIKPHKSSYWGIKVKNRESTNPQNYRFKYFFSKNLSKFYESTFFNRVNLDIILALIIHQPKIAIVTTYTSFTAFIIHLLSPFLKTKICLFSVGGLKGRSSLKNRNTITRKFSDWLIKRANYFFYSTDDNKEYFLARGVKNDRLYPLLSSVDTKFFRTTCNEPKKNYEYFLIASKLEKRKNIIEAILGYKKFLDSRPSIKNKLPRLLIVGIGNQLDFLKKESNDNIIFYGYVEDKKEMRSLIQGSIGLIMCSLYDPAPKIVNESLACSKPVLCRDSVGFADNLIEHKKNGYIYNSLDKNDIVSGYRWLEKNKLNENIKNFCKQKSEIWSPEQNAESVMKLFNKVLKDKV